MSHENESLNLRFARVIDELFPATHWPESGRSEIMNRFLMAAEPPPPKALSQRERDIAAFVELSGRRWGTNAMYKEDSWLAALAHERAWFRAELEKLPTHLEKTFPHSVGWTPIIAMRERCREDAP